MRKGRDHRRPQIEIHLPKYLSKNIQKHTHTKKNETDTVLTHKIDCWGRNETIIHITESSRNFLPQYIWYNLCVFDQH